MRWFRLSVLFIFTIILGAYVIGNLSNKPHNILKRISLGDSIDKITLKVSYGGFISMGEGSMENKGLEKFKGKTVYRLEAIAHPTVFFNALYNTVVIKANSLIDKNSYSPLKYSEQIYVAGEIKEEKEIYYDQDKHVMLNDQDRRIILPDTHDPLSLLFNLMRQDFQLGKVIDLNMNTNQKNYQFYSEVVDEKIINVKGKEFKICLLKGTVKRRDKSLRHSTEFSVWFLNDSLKVPLLAKIFTSIGPITVKLSGLN